MSRKIILDCDPGHDDAMAILLAHGNPEIELLAITTVAGNQTVDKTSLNARRVCTIAGIRDVPVAAGCDRPLIRELQTAAYIHGESGLDGPAFGEPAVPLDPRHAVDLLIELLMQSRGDIALVPTAPLTNIAMAVRKEPRIVKKVQEIILMGGAYTRGNTTPAAEFNIAVDPEAAAIVFTAGWPLTMVGLDLTHQALATPAILRRIAALGTPVARVIDPSVITCVDAFVAIETRGELTSGMTVTDFSGRLGQKNVQVATRLDVDKFWNLMVDAIERIGAPGVRAS